MNDSPVRPLDLTAIAELERRVLELDGLGLKLDWPMLRAGTTLAALTEYDADQLVGFVALYGFGGPPDIEITGMVDPAHRRRGVGGRLLQRALAVCVAEGYDRRLIIVPRESTGGVALATRAGGRIDHTEYGMVLDADPTPLTPDPRIGARPAEPADVPALRRILESGFGPPPAAMLENLHTVSADTLMIELDGAVVGTIRLSRDGDHTAIYGFVIDPAFRGRGIGTDVLHRVCTDLRSHGVGQVSLEVEVENERALHLYTSTGFTPARIDDYYRLPAGP